MDMDIEPNWIDLPLVPLMNVFSFLAPRDICKFGQSCKTFLDESYSNEVWNPHCRRLKLQPNQERVAWQCYQDWVKVFGFSETAYIKVKNLFDRAQTWSKKAEAPFKFLPPVTLENIVAAENHISACFNKPFKFPDDIRVFYLLSGGQRFVAGSYGLFGGYHYYNDLVSLYLEPFDSWLKCKKVEGNQIAKGLFPICQSPATRKVLYLVLYDCDTLDLLHNVKRGQIVEASAGLFQWHIANSFSALLEHRVRGYESGTFPIHPQGFLSLFPTNTEPVTTEGISIKAAPLFIPEKSTRIGDPRYLWAYSITMSMSDDESGTNRSQLTRRHWEIRDADGPPQVVDGEGVIGAYPQMHPGAFFRYESCCPLSSPTGSMGGHFQMKRPNGVLFNAVVPTWRFSIPEMIQDYDEESDD